MGDWNRPVIALSKALDAAERAEVERHERVLIDAVAPGTRASHARAVAAMLVAFPAGATDERTALVRAEAYLEALDDLPDWAVEAARRAVIRGEDGRAGQAFAPSPPEFRRTAARFVEEPRAALYRVRRLLAAEVDRPATDEQMARAVRAVAAVKAALDTPGSGANAEAPREA